MRERVTISRKMAVDRPRPNYEEVRCRTLAKAGTELVEGRTLVGDLPDPPQELQETTLST